MHKTGLPPIAFLAFLSLPSGFTEAGGPKKSGIVDPSDWNVTITYQGAAAQKAAIRLRNGVVYPAINDVPSGTLYVDNADILHIAFQGHPKVAIGEATLERVGPGRWRGILTQPSGDSVISMVKK